MASLRWFWHVLRSARGAGGVARGARPVEGTGRTAAPPDEPVTLAGPGGPRPRHIPAECDRCGGRLRPPAAATGAPFGDEWACPDCGRVRPDWPGIDWSPAELADTDMAPPPPAGPPWSPGAAGPGYLAELDAWLGELLGWIEALRAEVRAAAEAEGRRTREGP